MSDRKIVQIAFRADDAAFALADDGTVWRLEGDRPALRWKPAQWPPLPSEESGCACSLGFACAKHRVAL